MSSIATKDGVEIFYKDWGKGQPIVFSHGWPLSADDWDAQMMFFLNHGYRVIATTAAAMADPARPVLAMTWITTPMTSRR
jgi:pimeloyl-ACP methyl ester carboxylesterase